MISALVEMFQHNLWANLRLLDACTDLVDDQLAATATGTYGPLGDTLVHLLAAEERYVSLLTDHEHDQPLMEEQPWPGLPELQKRAQASGAALIALAPRLRPQRIFRGTRRGRPYEFRAAIPLVQAINHATEHRAHVTTILTQLGIEPPALDGWNYARAVG